MSCLHTVNKGALLPSCAALLKAGDAIIFIEDGIYRAMQEPDVCLQDIKFYALSEDLKARGMTKKLNENISPVDYTEFVTLCCEHDKIVNWF